MSKFSNILTMVLVVLIVAILGVVGYFAYDTLHTKKIDANAKTAIDEFESATKKARRRINNNTTDNTSVETDSTSTSLEELATKLAIDEENRNNENVNNNENPEETPTEEEEPEKVYYEGIEMKGRIEIPATKVDYPVLANAGKKAIEVAVGIAYGPGLNEVGNTTIFGHNYRNGAFFSNNKKLKMGDKIYITDQRGDRVTYIIYNMYETTPNDADYMIRETNGRREISLQTCTDDSKARIIIWAAEEGSILE